jgi:hypothetical protein
MYLIDDFVLLFIDLYQYPLESVYLGSVLHINHVFTLASIILLRLIFIQSSVLKELGHTLAIWVEDVHDWLGEVVDAAL